MSRADILFDAITNIREELVEEALSHRFRRRVPWGKYMGLAACLVLVVCVGWFGLLIAGGGMGGGSDFMNGSSGAVSGDTAPPQVPEAPAGEAVPGDSPALDEGTPLESVFTAVVLEVHEGYLLVEPLEGEEIRRAADRITVSTGELEDLPELEAGDLVAVAFGGGVMESYPAQLGEVYSIELAE